MAITAPLNKSVGPTRSMTGGNYVPPYQAPRRPISTRYGASIGEIMAVRNNRSSAYDQQGRPVQPGTVLNVAGYNTSGVGEGTPGYRGSGERSQGYSYERQGNAESKRTPDYSTHFGGLNEFHRMNQGMSDWDRLQNEAQMDRQDAVASQLGQFARIAGQRGDSEAMDMYSRALNDRLAQRMAAQGGGGIGGFGMGTGGAPSVIPGSQADIDRFTAVGEEPMVQAQMGTPDLDPNSWEVQAMLDQAALDNRIPISRYGTGSAGQGVGQSTFTNAQGSAGPGGTRTSYGGIESGPAFFQGAADRQRTANRFAAPSPGYNGSPANDLGAYSERLLAAKQKLGKK